MIALLLLLLALVPHSSALPLQSTEKDNRLFAEVRSAAFNSDVVQVTFTIEKNKEQEESLYFTNE